MLAGSQYRIFKDDAVLLDTDLAPTFRVDACPVHNSALWDALQFRPVDETLLMM